MATGIPIIASRVGGVPEILNSPSLGMMVSSSSLDELTDAMERLCNMDEVERNGMGDLLRERVLEEFTKEKMTSAISKEYLAVMNIPSAS